MTNSGEQANGNDATCYYYVKREMREREQSDETKKKTDFCR